MVATAGASKGSRRWWRRHCVDRESRCEGSTPARFTVRLHHTFRVARCARRICKHWRAKREVTSSGWSRGGLPGLDLQLAGSGPAVHTHDDSVVVDSDGRLWMRPRVRSGATGAHEMLVVLDVRLALRLVAVHQDGGHAPQLRQIKALQPFDVADYHLRSRVLQAECKLSALPQAVQRNRDGPCRHGRQELQAPLRAVPQADRHSFARDNTKHLRIARGERANLAACGGERERLACVGDVTHVLLRM